MTDPIDLADVANFDPIEPVDERDPYVWASIADRLNDATKAQLLEYAKGII